MSKTLIVQVILLLISYTIAQQCPKPPEETKGICAIQSNSCKNGKLLNGKSCPVGTKCCPGSCGGSLCLSINIKLLKIINHFIKLVNFLLLIFEKLTLKLK